MSSLAEGRGLEWELGWLGGLYTAAELAAADLLLQLRFGEAEAAAASTSSSPSLRSAGSCWDWESLSVDDEEEAARSLELETRARTVPATSCLEGLSVVVHEQKLESSRIGKDTASSLGSMELDTRARKRYRQISELYAATTPVKAAAAVRKRKRRQGCDGSGD